MSTEHDQMCCNMSTEHDQSTEHGQRLQKIRRMLEYLRKRHKDGQPCGQAAMAYVFDVGYLLSLIDAPALVFAFPEPAETPASKAAKALMENYVANMPFMTQAQCREYLGLKEPQDESCSPLAPSGSGAPAAPDCELAGEIAAMFSGKMHFLAQPSHTTYLCGEKRVNHTIYAHVRGLFQERADACPLCMHALAIADEMEAGNALNATVGAMQASKQTGPGSGSIMPPQSCDCPDLPYRHKDDCPNR